MAERYVLNASALLCLLDDEPGAERVAEVLDHAAVTAVSVAAVAAEMMRRGVGREEASALLASLHLRTIEIGFDQAIAAAAFGVRATAAADPVERWCWLAAAKEVGAVAMASSDPLGEAPDDVGLEVVGRSPPKS